ncbi:TPA: exodeoxyribonuclease V subunit alpha [Pasteurella multocida]|uniref:exodeoxyribonuclease V subunit alpha n=1 Tax=Pasteurella multocida TaxID=747 RepID=UPI002024CE3E|nr:exodeoxyribonuclease V subunit alpha [Pasteurella multocida]MEB3484603.1 exodeoxyribonuclease V subunit alpha [Pasteurella multocida]MEB3494380.1 exodeoxyribonuclease V subunit alpha [Pasteurella multocida]URJ96383.1 exodeoxyribonuclease V subunit alpha [Pasteurella multocida]HDR0967778.1 exodeoxyribonuclease V subunit alpha [Pasteurella multocida]HDR0969979.1 exodeoxyribonuclease V subunit alpha [Pasteurella multocida]
MLATLKELKQHKVISEGDYYFAQLIAGKQPDELSREQKNLAILLAALCSYSYQQGNTCLFLEKGLESNYFNLAYRTAEQHYLHIIQEKIAFLPIECWQSSLADHIAFTATPLEKVAPLVFQFNALYFYRIWQDEYRVAHYLQRAVQRGAETAPIAYEQINAILMHYFPAVQQIEGVNWQKVAVATALKQPFCLITGGPGTGKTTTVARLLLALQTLSACQLKIKLVAPTGKAAARLTESINGALTRLAQENMAISADLIASIPTTAQTLHRLLGIRFFEETPTFHPNNPLPLDVLVVDEASMIDLPLMAKLLQALKPNTKLILLGDENQLSPVEAGEMLGALSEFSQHAYSPALTQYLKAVADIELISSDQGSPLRDHLCRLHHSHRFSGDSGIGQLAQAINQGNVEVSWNAFTHFNDIEIVDFDQVALLKGDNPSLYSQACAALVIKSAVEKYTDYLVKLKALQQQSPILNEQQVGEIFVLFNAVRFLTALRVGELGVEQLNQKIAQRLQQKGLLDFKHERDWYLGKPIMIQQNDRHIGLYNGDIGLFLGQGKVWFEQGQGHYKTVLASRVPNYETAFVMTVHKSQGSEFAHTCLVLPTEPNPILSRELIYTGVTRAKQQLTVFSSAEIWKSAVKNPVKRQSGLNQLLVELFNKSD